LWFASEFKAIKKATRFEADPIQMILSPIGGIAEKSREKTLWKSLKTLTPGYFIKIKNSEVTKNKYYNIVDEINQNEYNRLNKMSINDVTDEFESIFDDSVKRLLISDAPMGAFVSGGIDSSLIASHASKHQKDLKLFTANVVGKYSELEDAKQLAKSLDKKLYKYDFEKDMAIRDLARVTWHYEAPLTVHFNALPFSNISAITKEQKVKAVLTGEGADELFLGYPRLLTRRYDKFIKSPQNLLNSIYSSIQPLKRYINNFDGSSGLTQVYELAAQGYTRQILREENIGAYFFLNEKAQKDHYLSVQMLNEGIVSLLWRNDRIGMMHSIESRFPFLDEKVITFALNLPLKFKIGRTSKFYNYKHPFLIDKYIVRSLGKRSLPDKLYNKKKNGFPLFGLRDMTVKSEFLYNSVFSDLFRLSNKQIDYLVKNTNNYHVGLIAMFEVWAKLFIENKTIEEVDNLNLKYLKIN
jgi:asparagine synthase (glutamine-hydrolysing)